MKYLIIILLTFIFQLTTYSQNIKIDTTFNEDGTVKLFTTHNDFDWSHIAESVDDSDLVEIENAITGTD